MAPPLLLTLILLAAEAPPLDERPGEGGEWGFRPRAGEVCEVNPPAFSFRPQKGAERYQVQVSRDPAFERFTYLGSSTLACHCPPTVLETGEWYWRFRCARRGTWTAWGQARPFTIKADAIAFPMPERGVLLARVPREHPRLFLRPEQLAELRALAAGAQKEAWKQLLRSAEAVLATPPPTAEPPKYPPGTVRLSGEWRRIWWGNRTYTVKRQTGGDSDGYAASLR